MADMDMPAILQRMDEILARLKTVTDDETRMALLREMAHWLTEAHSMLRRAA